MKHPEEKPLTISVVAIVTALIISFLVSQALYLRGLLDEYQETVIGGSLALLMSLVIILYMVMITRWDNSPSSEYERILEEKNQKDRE